MPETPKSPEINTTDAAKELRDKVKGVSVESPTLETELQPLHQEAKVLKEKIKGEKRQVLDSTKAYVAALHELVAEKKKEFSEKKKEQVSANLDALAKEVEETKNAVSEKVDEPEVTEVEVQDIMSDKIQSGFDKFLRSMGKTFGKVLDFLKKGGMSVLKLFGINTEQAEALTAATNLLSESPQVRAGKYGDMLEKNLATKLPSNVSLEIVTGSNDASAISIIESKIQNGEVAKAEAALKAAEGNKPQPPANTTDQEKKDYPENKIKYEKALKDHETELKKLKDALELAKSQESQAMAKYLDELAATYIAKVPVNKMIPKEKYCITLTGILYNQMSITRKAAKGNAPDTKPDENRR